MFINEHIHKPGFLLKLYISNFGLSAAPQSPLILSAAKSCLNLCNYCPTVYRLAVATKAGQ